MKPGIHMYNMLYTSVGEAFTFLDLIQRGGCLYRIEYFGSIAVGRALGADAPPIFRNPRCTRAGGENGYVLVVAVRLSVPHIDITSPLIFPRTVSWDETTNKNPTGT